MMGYRIWMQPDVCEMQVGTYTPQFRSWSRLITFAMQPRVSEMQVGDKYIAHQILAEAHRVFM
jgi:hypothetical protein